MYAAKFRKIGYIGDMESLERYKISDIVLYFGL